MKKTLLLLASAALLFAGCAKEQIAASIDDGESVEVTISAQLQNAEQTKASWDNDGNGAKVDHWIMEVYDAQGKLFDRQEKTDQSGLTNTFTVVLVKNQSYKFAFWADTKDSYNTADLRAVKTVSTVAGLDSRDAFFAKVDYTSSKSETITAKLYRPFAQVNIVTLDLKKIWDQMIAAKTITEGEGGNIEEFTKFEPKELKLSCKTYNQFNVLDGTVSDPQDKDLTLASCYANYSAHAATTTIFMDYLFASTDKELKDLTFTFKSNEVAINYDFTNIPLQRNYRTNIKGNLLSNDATWNVEIIPIWTEPEYEIERWSEGMITAVTPDDEGIYNIEKPSQLAWIAQQVNDGNTFAGKTVKLAEDIDLNNGRWTPIGKSDVLSFKGTFDGNGKTVKNLNVNLGNSSVNAGLFSFVNNATVKNFTIDGAKVSVVSGAAGVVVGKMFPGGLIEGVTVKNAELTGCRQMGGIVGSIYGKVKNCTAEAVKITATPNLEGGSYDNGDKCGAIVGFSTFDNNGGEVSGNIAKNVVIKGYRDIGGIVGAADCSQTTITNNEVHGAGLTADQTVNFYGKKDYNVGAIVGRVNAGTVDASNTSSEVIIKTFGNAVEKALDEAVAGSTVTVAENVSNIVIPATLAENVTLKQAENVVVDKISIPAGADIKGLVLEEFTPSIQAISGTDFNNGFIDISKDAKVENLLIQKCDFIGPNSKNRTAIFIEPSEIAQPKTIEIKDCSCTGTRYFVYTNGQIPGTTIKVTNCEVTNMFSWAIMVNNGNVAGIDIQNCTFSGGDIAKTLDGNKDTNFTFTFKNNTITGTTANFSLKAKPENTFISGNKKNGEDWNPSIGVLN